MWSCEGKANSEQQNINQQTKQDVTMTNLSSEKTRRERLLRSTQHAYRRFHKFTKLSRQFGTLQEEYSNDRSNTDTSKSVQTNLNGGVERQNYNRKSQKGIFKNKRNKLEIIIAQQNSEIRALKSLINELTETLQLSDVQNLALQVMLKKVNKAESKLPFMGKSEFRSKISESEKQLENLISELKEMSQTQYPTISSNCAHSSNTSYSDNEIKIEEEIQVQEQSIVGSQKRLASTQKEYKVIADICRKNKYDLKDISLEEAFTALEKAGKEINILRLQLEETQLALDSAQADIILKEIDLNETKHNLLQVKTLLNEKQHKINNLNENRKSLLFELKSAKEVLLSSLRNVHELEIESRKVPKLEAKVRDMEQLISFRRYEDESPCPMDLSVTFSISDTDSDVIDPKLIDQSIKGYLNDDKLSSNDGSLKQLYRGNLPPKSPNTKSPRLQNPRVETPSIGNFTVEPYLSSYPSDSNLISPGSGSYQMKDNKRKTLLACLRNEIQEIKRDYSRSKIEWAEERKSLESRLKNNTEYDGVLFPSLEDLRKEQINISTIEEKIKEVVFMLKSLNSLNIPTEKLGSMVVSAVESAYDPKAGRVQVFQFLHLLHEAARDYEKQSAEGLLSTAMEAISDNSNPKSDYSSFEDDISERPKNKETLISRRFKDLHCLENENPTYDNIHINV